MYPIIEYIKFLFRSRNQHSVHSPFIYKLVTTCFYDKTQYEEYALLKSFRKRLYSNESVIRVQDFGAGSRVFKNNTRHVHKIAKTAGIPRKRGQLLFRVVKNFKPRHILEIGTSLGLATTALSIGNSRAEIITIEGCKETSKVAKEQFQFYELNNIQLINDEFNKGLNSPELKNSNFDLIFIDGNHNKEATLRFFNSLLPNTNNESIMIFDDIHWSKGMTEAWESIKQDPRVKVSIDTFYWGMVFFRKEQEKEHFHIRV